MTNKLIEAADRLATSVRRIGYREDSNGKVTLFDQYGMEPLIEALTAYRAARESAGEVDADGLKSCPCCGVDMIGGARGNEDNAGEFFYYHPHNQCILQNVGVWPHNVDSWNTRSALAGG